MTQQTNGNDSIHNSEQGVQDGLTKREYFAAMAMQGMIGNRYFDLRNLDIISKTAVQQADALIEALNKER